MSDYLDISTSLYNNSLTLFVGTGFSKFITDGKAPNWVELLAILTKDIDKHDNLFNKLFNTYDDGSIKETKLDILICAQIIELEYIKKKKDIRIAIKKIIDETINDANINLDKVNELKEFFRKHQNINIVTTNYDSIFSDYILPYTSRIFVEGATIPRVNNGQNIYHIHGSISKPSSIVLTLNDYFKFQNRANYFSNKFFTLLQETNVVILGYSLGDFNLNTILNHVKSVKTESFRKTDLYYISRDEIPDILEKFYLHTYGIKSIANTETDEFFRSVEDNFDSAKSLMESVGDLVKVLDGKAEYSDDFLRLRVSLSKIIVQAGSIGIEKNDNVFHSLLLKLLEKKKQFTGEDNAWHHYEHLADWLIEVASIIKVSDSEIKDEYLKIVRHSLRKCSRKLYKGYSWHAYSTWNNRFPDILLENQIMLKDFIETENWDSDLEIEKICE